MSPDRKYKTAVRAYSEHPTPTAQFTVFMPIVLFCSLVHICILLCPSKQSSTNIQISKCHSVWSILYSLCMTSHITIDS